MGLIKMIKDLINELIGEFKEIGDEVNKEASGVVSEAVEDTKDWLK